MFLHSTLNPRFGNTNPSVTTFRTPFRIALDVRVNYGRSPQEQALTREQAEKVQARQKILQGKADSIYTELAQYLFALPPNYDAREAAKRRPRHGRQHVEGDLRGNAVPEGAIDPGQIRLLPFGLRDMVTVPNYRGQFFVSF